jgi:RNA methyltransferase, TrmH family
MLSLNQIKFLRSLTERKNRQKYLKFIAEGEKVVRELLREWPDRVDAIYADAARFQSGDFPLPSAAAWYPASARDMDRVSALHTPPGILALVRIPEAPDTPIPDEGWLLYLDGIADPGNLGAILRSADWFGMREIILGAGTVEWSNPKVVQAAMGSLFRVRLYSASLEALCLKGPERAVVAADLDGETLSRFDWPKNGILVLGGESIGLSSSVRNASPRYLRIPGDPSGRAESLNVNVAAGILLAAWHQQLAQSFH